MTATAGNECPSLANPAMGAPDLHFRAKIPHFLQVPNPEIWAERAATSCLPRGVNESERSRSLAVFIACGPILWREEVATDPRFVERDASLASLGVSNVTGDRQQKMRSILDNLGRQKGVVGATLITRDGLCVMNSDNALAAPETFSAMTAALMGAAETAFYELGGANELRVTAETDKSKMVALGANEQLLLVVVGNGNSASLELLKQAEAAAKELRLLLTGG